MSQDRAGIGPTTAKERYQILDVLRGLALMGIALANFPEFSLQAPSTPNGGRWQERMASTRTISPRGCATPSVIVRCLHSCSRAPASGCGKFVEGHRLPKVLGLFILGYLIGKHRLYARLTELPMKRLFFWSLAVSLPTSLLYAWSAVGHHPWGLTVHSLLYAVSVIPMAVVYVSGVCLVYLRRPDTAVFRWIAAPGRMALTNYISQSLVGIVLFYGLGFGLGTSFGLVYVELTALAVFFLQILLSHLWLRYFRFGPLEWLWRMLTYGRYFHINY